MTDTKAAQAASFDRAAETYERARPEYPIEAVQWLLESAPSDVLDLGAGTGKFTRALIGRVASVVAVDPSPTMLATLQSAVPGVRTAVGTAEAIPLPDASVDAVFAAQAWHWVDPERALPEVRRVLRPGGRLGLIWNVRDETAPWVAALTGIMQSSEAENFVTRPGAMPTALGPVTERHFRWQRPFDREGLLDLVRSRSYVITAAAEEQRRILTEIDELLDTHPDLRDPAAWSMPYITQAFIIDVE